MEVLCSEFESMNNSFAQVLSLSSRFPFLCPLGVSFDIISVPSSNRSTDLTRIVFSVSLLILSIPRSNLCLQLLSFPAYALQLSKDFQKRKASTSFTRFPIIKSLLASFQGFFSRNSVPSRFPLYNYVI